MSLAAFERRFKPRAGLTLVAGSFITAGHREDRRARYPEVVGVDLRPGPGVDLVHDLSQPLPGQIGFSHVDCISLLEHCERPWIVAENLEQAMLAGATMLLTVPFIWWLHNYPSDYWRFTVEAVRLLFPRIEWADLTYFPALHRGKSPTIRVDEQRYHARSQVFGFGVRI